MSTLNALLFYLTIPLTFFVCLIYVLRKCTKSLPKTHWLRSIHRTLRKLHKPLGIALTVVALGHTAICFGALAKFPFGLIAIISLILVSCTYCLRKKTSKWLRIHCVLTIIFILGLIGHIVEVEKAKAAWANHAPTTLVSMYAKTS